MTGESYSDLGGQLPDETQRELGLRKIAEVKDRLAAADKPCVGCSHRSSDHVNGSCVHQIAPRGEPCGCTERTNEGER